MVEARKALVDDANAVNGAIDTAQSKAKETAGAIATAKDNIASVNSQLSSANGQLENAKKSKSELHNLVFLVHREQ